MKFEIRLYHKRISDTELIDDIRETAKKLNQAKLTQEQYNRNGRFTAVTAKKRFGTWRKAIEKAGLIPYSMNLTQKELLDNMERTWRKLGKQPAMKQMKKHSICSGNPYERCFGSWNKALIAFDKYIKSGRKEYPRTEHDSGMKTIPSKTRGKHRTKRRVSYMLRYKVLKRDKYKCRICGSSPGKDASVKLHIDHILPWSKGGESVIGNLQTLCKDCNAGKGSLIN